MNGAIFLRKEEVWCPAIVITVGRLVNYLINVYYTRHLSKEFHVNKLINPHNKPMR